jgi:hypothetical protein
MGRCGDVEIWNGSSRVVLFPFLAILIKRDTSQHERVEIIVEHTLENSLVTPKSLDPQFKFMYI